MVLLLLFSKIDSKQKASMLILLSFLALFFFLEVIYTSEDVDYLHLANAYLFAQLIVPSLVPAAWKLYQSITGRKSSSILSGIWLVIPIVIFSISLIVRYLLGIDNIIDFHRSMDYTGSYPDTFTDRIYKMYYFNTFIVFYLVVFLENLFFIGYLISEMIRTKFTFRNVVSSSSSSSEGNITHLIQIFLLVIFLISSVRACLSRPLVLTHIYIDYSIMIMLSLAVIYMTCVVLSFNTSSASEVAAGKESNEDSGKVRLKKGLDYLVSEVDDSKEQIDNTQNLLDLQLIENAAHQESASIAEPAPEPQASMAPQASPAPYKPAETVSSKPATSFSSPQIAFIVNEETDDNSLSARFEHLIFKEKLYLSSGLTIVDVAERLGTNKTYVSRIVNSNYGMSFPDFINSLRIDYAEQYILHNVSAKQKDIAEACGFPSASAFNNTFKKITGLTPKIWMAANHIGK